MGAAYPPRRRVTHSAAAAAARPARWTPGACSGGAGAPASVRCYRGFVVRASTEATSSTPVPSCQLRCSQARQLQNRTGVPSVSVIVMLVRRALPHAGHCGDDPAGTFTSDEGPPGAVRWRGIGVARPAARGGTAAMWVSRSSVRGSASSGRLPFGNGA